MIYCCQEIQNHNMLHIEANSWMNFPDISQISRGFLKILQFKFLQNDQSNMNEYFMDATKVEKKCFNKISVLNLHFFKFKKVLFNIFSIRILLRSGYYILD